MIFCILQKIHVLYLLINKVMLPLYCYRKFEDWLTCLAEATFGSPHSLAFFSSISKSAFPAYGNIHSNKIRHKKALLNIDEEKKRLEQC